MFIFRKKNKFYYFVYEDRNGKRDRYPQKQYAQSRLQSGPVGLIKTELMFFSIHFNHIKIKPTTFQQFDLFQML